MFWQADLYRRPLRSDHGEPLWELLICSPEFDFTYGAIAPQADISSDWTQQQLESALGKAQEVPKEIQVFRPQSLPLLKMAGEALNIPVVARRHTQTLKQWLQQRASWYPNLDTYSGEDYNPLAVDRPPPVPLAEDLWGDVWRFAAISAGDFEQVFPYEPIPIRSLPESQLPSHLGVASTALTRGIMAKGFTASLVKLHSRGSGWTDSRGWIGGTLGLNHI